MRFSIGGVMSGVALLAVALGLVRLDVKENGLHRHAHDLVVGVMPMVTILVGRLLGAGLDLAAGRSTRRSLVGFQVAGWGAVLVYLSWCTATYEWKDRPLSWVARATSWLLSRGFALDDPGIMVAHMAVFLAPELAAAVVGGWLGARAGVVLIRDGVVPERTRASDTAAGPSATAG